MVMETLAATPVTVSALGARATMDSYVQVLPDFVAYRIHGSELDELVNAMFGLNGLVLGIATETPIGVPASELSTLQVPVGPDFFA
jgi:hypothetical protein